MYPKPRRISSKILCNIYKHEYSRKKDGQQKVANPWKRVERYLKKEVIDYKSCTRQKKAYYKKCSVHSFFTANEQI